MSFEKKGFLLALPHQHIVNKPVNILRPSQSTPSHRINWFCSPVEHLKRIHSTDRAGPGSVIKYTKPRQEFKLDPTPLPFYLQCLYITYNAAGKIRLSLQKNSDSIDNNPVIVRCQMEHIFINQPKCIEPPEDPYYSSDSDTEEDSLFRLAWQTLEYIQSHQETAGELNQLESKLFNFVQKNQ